MNVKTMLWLVILFSCSTLVRAQVKDNSLTKNDETQGWILLFNGKNLEGWTSLEKDNPPSVGWNVDDGVLSIAKTEGRGGDIISREEFENFELLVDFKIEKGGNSGIKYFFTHYDNGGWLGLEYQILDNTNHPDAKMGINGNRLQSALYDMFPVQTEQDNRVGEWNHAKIIAKESTVTHYLNGEKVLSFDRSSEAYKEAWEMSKFKDSNPPFGQVKKGHILLQDHGDDVSFKNVKIRRL